MAAPNYEQIQSFDHVTKQLKQAAIDEFTSEMYDGITREEVVEIATRIAYKFRMLGAELGAQWYDLCSELAGINADPAYVPEQYIDGIKRRAEIAANRDSTRILYDAFNSYLENEVNESIRLTGSANLWRDYERGICKGKWARVPVGETCAWCLMLASQGAWYLSEESALGVDPGHYHDGCDCKAVYHAAPEEISGYSDLGRFKRMYYDADNHRQAYESGREKIPEDLRQRIDVAKANHEAVSEQPWTDYNEDLIIMRYRYGLK